MLCIVFTINSSYATTYSYIIGDGHIGDNYAGGFASGPAPSTHSPSSGPDDVIGGEFYEVYGMDISMTGDLMTVAIETNFDATYSGLTSGDLFLSFNGWNPYGNAPYNNDNHQGLVNMNDMVLGIYLVQEGKETVFPLTLQAQLPAYLVKGLPNLSDEVIERLGLGERARRLGLYDRLCSANIIPHGGGYTFPHIQNIVSVIELEQERYFELSLCDSDGRQIISDVRDLPYTYRGMEVVERVVELGLGELVARLDPVYVLKL